MSKEVTITDDNFNAEVLESSVPVLLDFWAAYCGPCRQIAPAMEQIADVYDGRLKVGKVNIEEQAGLAGRHNIVSIPTLIIYKDGQAVFQQTGALPKPGIEALVQKYL